MTNPLVSVITATYAGDDPVDLAGAIDSIIAQDHRPLELLVVADGPLPEAAERALAQRCEAHDWISVHRLPRAEGPGAARNSVLGRCRGEYVAILDADDEMVADRISTQVAYLRTHDLDLVASSLRVMDQSGFDLEVRTFPESWRDVRDRAAYSCPTANTAMLFHRRILAEFRYPEDLRMGEDYRLWVTLMRAGRRIGNVPRPLTRYRTGSGYFGRRRGWSYAASDLVTKLQALPLVPWWQWPVVVAMAGVTFVVRLLPGGMFRVAYRGFERVGRGGAS